MPCNDKPTNCAPCQDCGTPGSPVLPRCQDVNLLPGVYRNAVVTVNVNGCISAVAAGEPDPYTPDPCCAPVGTGGGGGGGLPGPAGPPGAAGTVAVGTVSTGAPGSPVQVTNTGTPTAALLNFTIPQGQPGTSGSAGSGGSLSGPGLVFEDGLFQSVTPVWPPVYGVATESATVGVQLTATKSSTTGELSLVLDMTAYDAALRATVQGQVDALQAQVDSLQEAVTALIARANTTDTELTDITDRLDTCCPAP